MHICDILIMQINPQILVVKYNIAKHKAEVLVEAGRF